MSSNQVIRWIVKPAVFLACLGPAAWLIWALGGMFDYWEPPRGLSANPLSDITFETGTWALRFLCVTLAITPLRRISGWNTVVRFRRMTGLFAFFYGSLHFLIYAIADRLLSLIDFPEGVISFDTARRLAAAVGEDIVKRPYITVGFSAFVLMLPLAATSTAGMIRRLGGKRWQALHRLVYVSAIGGVVHYWWLVKADVHRPRNYAIIVGLLLLFRVVWSWRHGKKPVKASSATFLPATDRRSHR